MIPPTIWYVYVEGNSFLPTVETKGALDKELEAEIDIGDAADLEDRDAANGSAPPEKEPDETSL